MNVANAPGMTEEDVFWAVHGGLPREAPGSEETTRLLLRLAGAPRGARIADMGCGPGAATVVLAAETGGHVLAVDTHEPFLADVTRRAQAAGVADRVETRAVPMEDSGVDPGSLDLVWAEGSAYSVGVDAALLAWRPLLRAGGAVVLTEAEWTHDRPHPEAVAFWAAYPGMRSTAENVAAFDAAGWDVTALYRLPESDWEIYYGPVADRLATLRQHGATQEALAPHEAEIAVRRDHGRDYGYTGYVLRPRSGR